MSLVNKFFNFDRSYKIYLNKCRELAQSIVIKSEVIAQGMNLSVLKQKGIVDEYDKSSWRYYKNICGDYHFADEMMLVTSVDTLEEIEFTKENLKYHKATAREYRYGTRLYSELLARYPDQEILILGILYPADLNEALNAEEGKILSYPKSLVDPNEYSFIDNLQEWINGYLLRRTNPAYGISDEYWPISNLGIMYLNLLPAILTIRKSKCKTNEAHSYHVRRYLTSHGFLDEYLDAMTLRQSLRFYMNINWVERNIGKTETQKWLIREVMTARNLPIAEYDFKHDPKNQTLEIYPENFFRKNSLNGLENTSDLDDLTLHQLLLKEDPLAKDNPLTRIDHEPNIERHLENSLSNALKTKVLESKITDRTDAEIEKLSKTLFNLWGAFSAQGLFRSVVYFKDPVKGERRQLRAKDAFILYLYCYYRNYGIEFERIPDILVETIPLTHVTKKDLYSVVETKKKPTTKSIIDFETVEEEFVDRLIDSRVVIPPIVSIDQFYQSAKDINNALNKQVRWAYNEGNYIVRGYKEAMVYRMYCDYWIQLDKRDKDGGARFYTDFFNEMDIDFKGYLRSDYGNIAKSILESATGINLSSSKSLRVIHAAMLKLLKQLSSYSVQYIKESNEENLFIVDFPPPLPAKPNSYGKQRIRYEIRPPKIIKADEYGSEVYDGTNLLNTGDKEEVYQSGGESIIIDTSSDLQAGMESITTKFVVSGLDAWYKDDHFYNPDDLIPVPGMDSFAKLTPKQKENIRDFYGNDFRWLEPCETEEDNIIRISGGPTGFKYHEKMPIHISQGGGGFKYYTITPISIYPHTSGFKYVTDQSIKIGSTASGFKYHNTL